MDRLKNSEIPNHDDAVALTAKLLIDEMLGQHSKSRCDLANEFKCSSKPSQKIRGEQDSNLGKNQQSSEHDNVASSVGNVKLSTTADMTVSEFLRRKNISRAHNANSQPPQLLLDNARDELMRFVRTL